MYAVNITTKTNDLNATPIANQNEAAISPLAEELFLKNVFGFEVLGVLLLVIAVGTVALSRSKGGTHARH
jgi:NADH-quinone oxidoreductase subunit J